MIETGRRYVVKRIAPVTAFSKNGGATSLVTAHAWKNMAVKKDIKLGGSRRSWPLQFSKACVIILRLRAFQYDDVPTDSQRLRVASANSMKNMKSKNYKN